MIEIMVAVPEFLIGQNRRSAGKHGQTRHYQNGNDRDQYHIAFMPVSAGLKYLLQFSFGFGKHLVMVLPFYKNLSNKNIIIPKAELIPAMTHKRITILASPQLMAWRWW